MRRNSCPIQMIKFVKASGAKTERIVELPKIKLVKSQKRSPLLKLKKAVKKRAFIKQVNNIMNWHSNKRQLTHVYGLTPLQKKQPVSERLQISSKTSTKNCYSTHSTILTKSLNKILHQVKSGNYGNYLR